jgi:hypothetical protein
MLLSIAFVNDNILEEHLYIIDRKTKSIIRKLENPLNMEYTIEPHIQIIKGLKNYAIVKLMRSI